MIKEIYKEVELREKYINFFDTVNIRFVIKPLMKKSENGMENISVSGYHLEKIECTKEDTVNSNFFEYVESKVKTLNKKIETSSIKNWNIFYAYKELIQSFTKGNKEFVFNYFRGQNDDWKLIPSIFRDDTKPEFIDCYDKIYSDIAKEFPDKIKYVSYSRETAGLRAEQLAMLQHYGFRTSLLDITKNPFIALQFMTIGCDLQRWHNNIFELYSIDEEEHAEKNIFISTVKNEKNKRLRAQQGAFFDFDYIYDIEQNKIKPIFRIRIELFLSLDDIKKPYVEKKQEFNDFINVANNFLKEGSTSKSKDMGNVDNIRRVRKMVSNSKKHAEDHLRLLEENSPLETYKFIYRDIVSKLREYFYLEDNLFPDFEKYIYYVQRKNIEQSSKLNY